MMLTFFSRAICPSSLHGYEYVWPKFHRVLNMPPVLIMPARRIRPVCDYTRVTQGCEHALIT